MGGPFELGQGAMGVTYKAIDINLRCAVALKVISARFIGDEAARRRFVREARAAASVRHPNVASVFHLGQSADGYFYAMEFVEGDTLESLIKGCGRLEPKVALEITSQVAAGLGAINEQELVHRDIKPANTMVSLKDGERLTAKIIDLGLAKPVVDAPTDFAISVRELLPVRPRSLVRSSLPVSALTFARTCTHWERCSGRWLPARWCSPVPLPRCCISTSTRPYRSSDSKTFHRRSQFP